MDLLLASLGPRRLAEWLAYSELEPFGPAREDLRAGLVAAVVANTSFGRGKGSKTHKPSDFFANLADDGGPARRMGADDMAEQAMAMTRSMGGAVRMIPRPGSRPDEKV